MFDTRLCWMPFLGGEVMESAKSSLELANAELELGLKRLQITEPVTLKLAPGLGEGYEIAATGGGYAVTGGETGVLYGAYRLLMKMAAGESPVQPLTQPAFALRMLNHWDNMTGAVERGYAGASLFFKDNVFAYDPARIRRYARYLASIGINTVSVNNVNVHQPADKLITEELLPELAQLAGIFRPFGIRLLVSVDYALPVTMGLDTADPLDARVQAWWANQVELVYAHIPDLRGFLVKADSEFRPGPFMYGRDHAEGAKVLADALRPHGGVVVWRCFVYNCRQDWRDKVTDRPKAAFDTYSPLEGKFEDNVILQVKNGPYDFQVREPVSPLFFAMPGTQKALEVQLAQEYTGQQIDLYYMPPQWNEILSDIGESRPPYICAVTNLGDDENWTGHDMAQANLFAYGQMAWLGNVDGEAVARWWAALTYGTNPVVIETVTDMLMKSRAVYEQYNSPLGLCWMITPHTHYGPSPEGYEYSAWGTYLRANRDAVGIDRTGAGTGYADQYPPKMAAQYSDVNACPDKLLLFFHRLRYDHVMRDGRTLIQRIYDDHFEGAEGAKALQAQWAQLEGLVPNASFENVSERLARQVKNAEEWRDIINTYFYRYSGIEDVHGRKVYE